MSKRLHLRLFLPPTAADFSRAALEICEIPSFLAVEHRHLLGAVTRAGRSVVEDRRIDCIQAVAQA